MDNKIITRKKRAIIARKKKARRRRCIFFLICLFILTTFIREAYIENKSKDLYYAVEHYMTSGFFNSKKILTVDKMKLLFSDGSFAKIEVHGMYYKSPYLNKVYNANFEKDSNGSWKLKKVDEVEGITTNK